MSELQNTSVHEEIERVLVMGDLARLTPQQRNEYYKKTCDSLGLNPLTRPFEFIVLNGKLQMYARKDCADQLRNIHGVSIRITERTIMDDLMVVTAEATDRKGRVDSSIGAVSIAGLRGEAKANALMKAETKARRRVTLAICGLGILDETELDGAHSEPAPQAQRPADRLLAAQPAPKASPKAEEPAPKPAPKPEPKPEPKPATKEVDRGSNDDLFSPDPILDFVSVEAVKSSSGEPVWKAIDANNSVYAVFDPLLVEDIATAAKHGRAMQCTVNSVGKKSVITNAREVSE